MSVYIDSGYVAIKTGEKWVGFIAGNKSYCKARSSYKAALLDAKNMFNQYFTKAD